MTQKEFFKALEASMERPHITTLWSPHASDAIRLVGEDFNYCPITLVCEHVTNFRYPPYDWEKAAAALHLNKKTAHRIVSAADSGTKGKLRQKLIEICGRPEQEGV